MKAFVWLAFIPFLIKADVLCPNSKTSCPEDKQCCEVDGEYSCCDLEDVPDGRLKVFAGVEMKSSPSFANVSLSVNESMMAFGGCDLFSCEGTCCGSSMYDCCPEKMAACCGGGKCCGNMGKCCGTGCCGVLQTCCGNNGCCDWNYNCCASWCCKKGSRCGSRKMSCIAKGATIAPQFIAVLLTAASVFVFHRL